MNVLLFILAALGTILATWGTQTRGTLSPAIGSIGGILWLASIVWAFIELGFGGGLLLLLGTFVAGAILTKLLPNKA